VVVRDGAWVRISPEARDVLGHHDIQGNQPAMTEETPRRTWMLSMAERLALLGPEHVHALFDRMDQPTAAAVGSDWGFWSRPAQRTPRARNWRTWLILAGRGFGKTRAGAEWVREIAETRPRMRIALVGATMAETRRVMVEGDSGLLAVASIDRRPVYEPSLHKLTWPNGTIATLFSAAEPESLRGSQHHFAWADEIAKWPNGLTVWENLSLTLRIGVRPRTVATTTPRPVPLVRMLAGPARKDVAITRGRTRDNAGILARDYLNAMDEYYGGTRLGRQELDGELIDSIEGALWDRDLIETQRVAKDATPEMRRVVVGVDPPAGAGDGADACGIVVVGLGEDGRGYVLDDASVQGRSPEGWARAVAAAAARWRAERVIAEVNNGGAMVKSVLHAVDATMPIRSVHAARGKVARAEPVAALYESGKAWHAGCFTALEDELCGLIVGGDYAGPGRSPDRADALVWALTELMLESRPEPRVWGL